MTCNYAISGVDSKYVFTETRDSEKSWLLIFTEMADSMKLLSYLILNWKIMSEVQLHMEPIIMHQTKEWVSELTDDLLNSNCLEQNVKSTLEKARNACAECIWRSFNTECEIYYSSYKYCTLWPHLEWWLRNYMC
jgi:hypothetical protein